MRRWAGQLSAEMKAFFVLLAAMMLLSFGMGCIMPVMPVHAQALGASGVWIGLIMGASPLVRGLLQILFGRLADVYRMKVLMLVGLGGYTLAALGLYTAVTPGALLVWRVLQGAMLAVVQPAAWAYAGLLTPAGREGTVMSVFNVSFIGGFALGPLTGSLLYARGGMGVLLLTMTILSGLAFFLVWAAIPERPTATPSQTPALTSFSVIFRDPMVQGIVAGRFSLACGWAVFEAMLPLWVAIYLGLPPYVVGLIMSLQAVSESGLQLAFGMLADRTNRRRLALTGLSLAVLSIYLMPVARTPAQLVAAALLLSSSTGAYVPAMVALSVERGRRYGMGTTLGITNTAMSLGIGFGSVLGGTVMDLFNIQTSFWAAALVGTTGVAVFAQRTRVAPPLMVLTPSPLPGHPPS